ncbi:MAG: neutral zinc metallopeptidase, partial [Rhodobacterales bacterium]|nr:neutral zinc metallopeptidase [Rhodobacterales bacterium]
MRWRGRRHSSNIEDRRGASGGGGLGGGFPRLGRTRVGLPGGRIRIPGGGRGGLGGLAIIAVIFIGAMALGVDPATLVGTLTGYPYATSSPSAPAPPPADVRARRPAGENDLADMVAVV